MTLISSPSLDTMPNVVIGEIMKKSDWKSVLCLRQVSRRLRFQVDNAPESSFPDKGLSDVFIYVWPKKIHLDLSTGNQDDKLCFVENGNQCSRKWNKKDMVFFKNENLVDLAIKDLELVLRFQKSIGTLYLHFSSGSPEESGFSQSLENILQSRSHPLKTAKFKITCYNSIQVMNILPYLDPKSLKSINLCRSGNEAFRFDESVKTEQWKNADKLRLYWFDDVVPPVKNMTHFLNIYVEDTKFSVSELDFLKTAFSKNADFIEFTANSVLYFDLDEFSTLWERPYANDGKNCWYFRIPNSDRILLICCKNRYRDEGITIEPTTLDQVPNGAIIRDI